MVLQDGVNRGETSIFIDLHTHILAATDDGAQNISESINMAEIAVKDGIEILAATPHVRTPAFNNRKEDILCRVESLNKELQKQDIALNVLPGAEYRLEYDLPQRLGNGELLTINNTGLYLLVELPTGLLPPRTEDVIYEIQIQGIIPIIAHPERNDYFVRYPGILQSYVDRGVLTQITSASVTGLHGKTTQRAAWKFMEYGMVHILASDGHSSQDRSPVISKAWRQIQNRWGSEYANLLAYENPLAIINAQPVENTSRPGRLRNLLRGMGLFV